MRYNAKNGLKKTIGILLGAMVALMLPFCGASASRTGNSNKQSNDDKKWATRLNDGIMLLRSRSFQQAIDGYFDPIIVEMKSRYNDPKTRYYCANNSTDALFYMMIYASEAQEGKINDSTTSAVAVTPVWSEALYYKAYALIELRKVDDAQEALKAAVKLSPHNSIYLSELGYTYQIKKDWKTSYDLYEKAYGETSEDSKSAVYDKTRALRGMGYNLVEMNKLDEAKKKYEEALAIDPSDEKSKAELKFIEEKKRKGQK